MFNKQDDCFRLSRRLTSKFDSLTRRAFPDEALARDMHNWQYHQNGIQLAAWIDLLAKATRDAIHEVQAPERLRPEPAKMADRALEQMASDSADPDDERLLRRIQTDPNLAWDPTSEVFR